MSDLTKLKDETLDELIKVTDEEGLEPEDKFELLMTRYVADGNTDLLPQALSVAKQIEDISLKGQALMQILSEIDIAQTEETLDDEGDSSKGSQDTQPNTPETITASQE